MEEKIWNSHMQQEEKKSIMVWRHWELRVGGKVVLAAKILLKMLRFGRLSCWHSRSLCCALNCSESWLTNSMPRPGAARFAGMPHKKRTASHASSHSNPQLQNIRHVSVDQKSVHSSGGSKAKLRCKWHSYEFISFYSSLKAFLMIFVYNADVLFENFRHLPDYCT